MVRATLVQPEELFSSQLFPVPADGIAKVIRVVGDGRGMDYVAVDSECWFAVFLPMLFYEFYWDGEPFFGDYSFQCVSSFFIRTATGCVEKFYTHVDVSSLAVKVALERDSTCLQGGGTDNINESLNHRVISSINAKVELPILILPGSP